MDDNNELKELNYFEKLAAVPVADYVENKNGFNYLSWACAWYELKKRFPDARYYIYENEQGWNYFTDGRTAWVKTGVTVAGIEYIEQLPIMNYSNKSIPLDKITSFEVNKTIQRSLTKAIARHGLGISLYFSDFNDVPAEADGTSTTAKKPSKKPAKAPDGMDANTNYRKALKALAEENGLNVAGIIQICGLTNESSNEEFFEAYKYARGLVS